MAIGECGLDYHYDHSPRDLQREVFAAQVALAKRLDLALVVHTREAWDDTFSILESEGVPERTWSSTASRAGSKRQSDAWTSGPTSPSAASSPSPTPTSCARRCPHCPLDSLLIETDSPFLTPVPYRGRRNNPGNVALVGTAVAKVKGFEPEVLAAVSWMNAEKAFGLGS